MPKTDPIVFKTQAELDTYVKERAKEQEKVLLQQDRKDREYARQMADLMAAGCISSQWY